MERALQLKILKENDLSKVEFVRDSGWTAVRLTAPGVQKTSFRKLAKTLLDDEEQDTRSVTTRQPKLKQSLFQKCPEEAPLLADVPICLLEERLNDFI